jgi:hypothetical protein
MKENTINRKIVNYKLLNKSIIELRDKINYRLEEKGYGTMASMHEIMGIVTEEYHELIEDLHQNNIRNFE